MDNNTNQRIYLNTNHDDGYVYASVGEVVAALLKMPQSAPCLLTIHRSEGLDCHDTEVTAIPTQVRLVKHEDYYQDKEPAVEIYAF